MSARTNFLRHEAYDGLTAEHASSKNQVKNATARTVAGTAVEFGPFQPGDYEMCAVDNADAAGASTKADNLVYRFNTNTGGTAAVAASDHIWLASNNLPKLVSFTPEYPYISIIRAGGAKTMLVSIARVKGRS